ncbi:hypothetical protein [Actinospica robiniae]|uniref:hypothetical protein n=1 Tax=Actinospica robiniae TaxID=304901 RepID=UPI00041A099C|nr:hypothetical protein [Actinospica robiniae]
MSDYFDTQLREGSARVAGSLTAPTAAAVREHSNRRARRARTGTAALAAVAVLALGGVTFGLEHQGGATRNTVAIANSATAGNATTPSASPSTSAAVSSTSTSSMPESVSTASSPNPDHYVAAAWLSESHLPYATNIAWQPNPQVLGTKIGGAVQLIPASTDSFANLVGGFSTYCAITALADNAVASQRESFYGQITGSILPSTAGVPATAAQSTIFYASPSAATAAWDAIGSGYSACAKFETGSVSAENKVYPSTGTVSRIRSEPNVQCWTNLNAVTLEAGVSDFMNDACFVRHGTLISSVAFDFEGPPTLSSLDLSAADATLASELAQALNAYGSS